MFGIWKGAKCAGCKKSLHGEVAHHVIGEKRYCLKCWLKRLKPGPRYAMAE